MCPIHVVAQIYQLCFFLASQMCNWEYMCSRTCCDIVQKPHCNCCKPSLAWANNEVKPPTADATCSNPTHLSVYLGNTCMQYPSQTKVICHSITGPETKQKKPLGKNIIKNTCKTEGLVEPKTKPKLRLAGTFCDQPKPPADQKRNLFQRVVEPTRGPRWT